QRHQPWSGGGEHLDPLRGRLGKAGPVVGAAEGCVQEGALDVGAQDPGSARCPGSLGGVGDEVRPHPDRAGDDRRQEARDPGRGQGGRDRRYRLRPATRVMAGEAVDLEVDEAGRDQLAGTSRQVLPGTPRRPALADPGDGTALDQDARGPAGEAGDRPGEQGASVAHRSPRAAERSPPAEESRERASPAARPQRSMRMAILALPPDSARTSWARAAGAPVRSATIATARPRSFWLEATTPTIRPR